MAKYIVNFTEAGRTYSNDRIVVGTAAALDEAKRLAGDDARFVKKGVGPAGYIGASGVAYVTEVSS